MTGARRPCPRWHVRCMWLAIMMWRPGTGRRALGIILLLGIGASGCGGDADSHPKEAASVAPSCQAPPDGATPGCFATPSSMLCSPTECKSLCTAGLTPVTCTGSGPMGPIPAPEPNAGCTIVAIPTPSNQLFYCCPCGAG
jgi:hypothetical protein